MNRNRVLGICLLFIGMTAAVSAVNGSPTVTAKLPLRVGVVPYSDPSKSKDPDVLEDYLARYFSAVTANTRTESAELSVRMVKGSYYQILQWLRDGTLDAAVVSPFSAYLVMNDRNLAAFPLIEFVRPHSPSDEGHTAARVRAEKNGHPLSDPNKRYDECLDEIAASLLDPKIQHTCQIQLVNHLSTTGFVQPIAHAKEYIRTHRQLTVNEEETFWTRFLEWSRFSIWHNGGQAPPKNLTIISFDYRAGSSGDRLTIPHDPGNFNDVLLLAVKRRTPATPGRDDAERFTAIKSEQEAARSALTGMLGIVVTSMDGTKGLNRTSPWAIAASTMKKTALPENKEAPGYVGVSPWMNDRRDLLSESIRRTFALTQADPPDPNYAPQPLARLYTEWYERGHYAFTIDELIDMLNVDQITRHSPCAALVLPGGGVRATYQSVILDSLYNDKIENAGPCRAKNSLPGQTHLQITSIAGTSGGALLGALAAHRTNAHSHVLENQWIANGKVITTPSKVFPPLGVFRWISILLTLVVFAGVSAIHLPTSSQESPELPVWFTVSLTGVIAGAPFLIWRNTLLNPSYHPAYEGLAFMLVVLTAHYFHSVCVVTDRTVHRGWFLAGAGLAIAGVYAATVMISLSTHSESQHGLSHLKIWWLHHSRGTVFWSMVSTAGAAVVIAGIVIMARSLGVRPDSARKRMYREAFPVLLLLVTLTTAFFWIGRKSGDVTELEMTSAYWVWVLTGALFSAKLIVEIARPYRGHRHLEGFNFLVTPSGMAPFPYTPTLTLVAWGSIGIAVYLIFIAPALYSGERGRQTFQEALKKSVRLPGMQSTPIVPLVVSVTGFGAQFRDFDRYRGDYYAYLDSWKNSVGPARESLYPLSSQQFDDAVFASGSPFPIYPAASVSLESRRRPGLFVDGGYAHRVPIEAALATHAGQILVIENIARRDVDAATKENSRAGALAINIGKAFEYLFDRSQQVDLDRSKSVLVGTIYPDWTNDDPFLMDFRETVVQWLQSEANGDLMSHRVGRIESWGMPLNLGVEAQK